MLRLSTMETLPFQHSSTGMPPMGLCMSCTDEDFAVVIDYMLSKD